MYSFHLIQNAWIIVGTTCLYFETRSNKNERIIMEIQNFTNMNQKLFNMQMLKLKHNRAALLLCEVKKIMLSKQQKFGSIYRCSFSMLDDFYKYYERKLTEYCPGSIVLSFFFFSSVMSSGASYK